MTGDVHFRGGNHAARKLAHQLVAMLAGREPDMIGIAKSVFTTVGFAALSDIKNDFVTKAKGGTGEDGVSWAPLKPQTIARRRIGPGDRRQPHIADRLQAERDAAREARRRFDAAVPARKKKLVARLVLSMSPADARKRASEIIAAERRSANFRLRGQIALARKTGQRRVDVLSQRRVETLRDTGVLLNSLSPGQLSGAGAATTYTPPGLEGGAEQVFDLFESGVIVGTTVAYAQTHQEGDPARGIPSRPFLPERIPQGWLDRWAAAGQSALVEGVRLLYAGAS